ncbi:MMPL family transporter [Streptomyces sp. URMC 126]|uniref:MMPL family transporter n=1 Tax=Streptomyces sp. URMC 126 TaxID=3423401 RepID=UPI003F1C6BC2
MCLSRVALRIHRRHRPVLAVAALAVVALSLVSAGLWSRLGHSDYWARGTQAERGRALLADRFHIGSPGLSVLASAGTARDVDTPALRAAGTELTRRVGRAPGVSAARSYWTTGDPALRSRDRHSALILVEFAGDDAEGVRHAKALLPRLRSRDTPLRLQVTGPLELARQVTERSRHDLLVAESAVLPAALAVLGIMFGSWTAALLLLVPALAAIVGTLAVLRLLATFSSFGVAPFAPNFAVALGVSLAVDYGLLIVTRYREELAGRPSPRDAVAACMATAGRTVLFSAVTVAACLSALLVFPVDFVRSMAWAGIVVVLASGLASVVLLPALLHAAVRRIPPALPTARRAKGSRGAWSVLRRGPRGVLSRGWLRVALLSTRHPLLLGGACLAVLVLLALPLGHARFGFADERVLPPGTEVRATAATIGRTFSSRVDSRLTVVLPRTDATRDAPAVHSYALRLSALPHVTAVAATTGRYHRGGRTGDGPAACGRAARRTAGTCVVVDTDLGPAAPAASGVLDRVRAVAAPGPRLVTGNTALLADTKAAVGARLPWALGIVAAGTLLLVFAFTAGVLIPFKALVLSAAGLAAGLGIAVYVFQDGAVPFLADPESVPGLLDIGVLMTTAAIAWGLCLDYEVFLLSRIQDAYRDGHGNDRAVVLGVARTGRLVTAAALVVALAMTALAASSVAGLRVMGVSLMAAVVLDATLVRGVLVPAVMALTGRANWWAPAWATRRRAPYGRSGEQPRPGP